MIYYWSYFKTTFKYSNIPEEILLRAAAAAAKSLQSCPTLCNPMDGSPPGFPVPGILQARKLEWVAISFSNAWKWKVKVKSLSCVRLFTTPWTVAYQAPLSMDFPGKSTGVGCHCLLWLLRVEGNKMDVLGIHWPIKLSQVKRGNFHELPVQFQCTILDAWGWCTGTTQRDGVGREEGSGWGAHVYLWWIRFDVWQN